LNSRRFVRWLCILGEFDARFGGMARRLIFCFRWVKTENGQNFADSIGVKEPPMSLEKSVNGVLEQVDSATKDTTSGTFVSYDGTPIAW
jgi:hypothetical protein